MIVQLRFSFFILMVVCGLNSCNTLPQDERPNILVILADDLGYADLSIHGSKDCLTPNIDLIAAQGVQCLRAYVSAPQCSPSRAGLMTGRYQQRFGHEANPEKPFVQKFGLDPNQKTITKFMQESGYSTQFYGKWDLGAIPSAQPWSRGVDSFFGHYAGARSFYSDDNNVGAYQRLRKSPNDTTQYDGYLSDLITDDAIASLERIEGKPWFALMSYLNPHWPMEPKKVDFDAHSDTKDMHRRAFLGLMDNLDQNVGKLLTHLEQSGQVENTVVIFLSDNGAPTGKPRKNPNAKFQYGKNASLNDPFRGVKGEVFEGGIRTPLFIKYPKRLRPGIFPHPVTSLDLLPTCIALAQGSVDRPLDGKDLMPYLTQEIKVKPHATLYWRWFNNWAILHDNWKLVVAGHNNWMLFDIDKDPYEKNNIIEQHPVAYKRLKKSLIKWNNELNPADWRYPSQVKSLSKKLD